MKRSELEKWEERERSSNELHEMLLKSDHYVLHGESAWKRVLHAREHIEAEKAKIEERKTNRRELLESLPSEWGYLHLQVPCEPYREKVTLRINRDVLRFFRKMGKGYQARLNAVLEAYVHVRKEKMMEEWERDRGF